VLADLAAGRLQDVALGDYLKELGSSEYFSNTYLVPLMAAIWSGPDTDTFRFPAATFATFFRNHGMLELSKRPQWQTVVGGSHAYVSAFRKSFRGKLLIGSPVRRVLKSAGGQTVVLEDGRFESFDRVIFATHADETLALIEEPTERERELLGAWRYSKNHTVLHTDTRILPPRRRLWAAWNYGRVGGREKSAPVAITYYMNRLQGLKTRADYFVTLNRTAEIDPARVLYETHYTHPIYTPESVATQSGIQSMNGEMGRYFCGAYLGYGFHEDGVKSALEACRPLGGTL
jgi:predicted NAD/FAD-binding protein